MQTAGRRLARWLDARFGPDRARHPGAPSWPAPGRSPSNRPAAACWCHDVPLLDRAVGLCAVGSAAAAPRTEHALPDLPGLPREHLPVADGRDRAARRPQRRRPGRRGHGGQRRHRGLARRPADEPAGPGGAGPARLRRLGAPGPAVQAFLAGRTRPVPGHGRSATSQTCGAWPGPADGDRIRLFGEVGGLSRSDGGEIPDPYGGDAADYDHVLGLISTAAPVIAARLARLLEPGPWPGPAPDVSTSSSAASRIGRLTGLAVREARVAGSQHGYQHLISPCPAAAARSPRPSPPATMTSQPSTSAAFAAEANGLRWLAEAAAVPVPEVLAVTPAALVISMIPPGTAHAGGRVRVRRGPGPAARGRRGRLRRAVAGVHRQPAAGQHRPARPRLAATGTPQRRLLPYLRPAVDAGALRPDDARLVEAVTDRIGSLAGPRRAAEPDPRRLLGRERAVVRRPGLAHRPGGARRSPRDRPGHAGPVRRAHLDRIMAGYQDAVPLAAGWRSRIPLHQLHPLLVHACLFGAVVPGGSPFRRPRRAVRPDPDGGPARRGWSACTVLVGRSHPARRSPRAGRVVIRMLAAQRLGSERERDPERRALPRGRCAPRRCRPARSTSASTMARPSPLPPVARVRAWSAR